MSTNSRSLSEIDEETIETFKGTVSLPFEKGDNAKIAVKIIDDRGIESLRVISLQTSLRGVILPPDFWTLFYLRGESPTSSWSNFPAGVTTLS